MYGSIHVKPHGALHHRIVRDEEASDAVARAIRDVAPELPFVVLAGPAGTGMRRSAKRHGLRGVLEAFPDRAYLVDGRLAPRGSVGAKSDRSRRGREPGGPHGHAG